MTGVQTCALPICQILGASGIPESLKAPIGDDLVMGIQYNRDEMTLSALARDTVRIGALLADDLGTGIGIEDAPDFTPLPETATAPPVALSVDYVGLPAAAPGDSVNVVVHVTGDVPENATLTMTGPEGWTIVPDTAPVSPVEREIPITLHAPHDVDVWPERNLFTAKLDAATPAEVTFGVAGAGLWQFLGVHYDALPEEGNAKQRRRAFNHHFVSLEKAYLPEPEIDVEAAFAEWSRKLGKRAVVAGYEREVDPTQLIGLTGAYCCYLTRTVISPEVREAYIVVGNNDSFRPYLNGELVGEEDECTMWSPFNNVYRIELREGENTLLVKLVKHREGLRFTLGFRAATDEWRPSHNCEDWLVDLADVVP